MRPLLQVLLLALLSLVCCCGLCSAKFVSGNLTADTEIAYITKFCYSNAGTHRLPSYFRCLRALCAVGGSEAAAVLLRCERSCRLGVLGDGELLYKARSLTPGMMLCVFDDDDWFSIATNPLIPCDAKVPRSTHWHRSLVLTPAVSVGGWMVAALWCVRLITDCTVSRFRRCGPNMPPPWTSSTTPALISGTSPLSPRDQCVWKGLLFGHAAPGPL